MSTVQCNRSVGRSGGRLTKHEIAGHPHCSCCISTERMPHCATDTWSSLLGVIKFSTRNTPHLAMTRAHSSLREKEERTRPRSPAQKPKNTSQAFSGRTSRGEVRLLRINADQLVNDVDEVGMQRARHHGLIDWAKMYPRGRQKRHSPLSVVVAHFASA